MASSGNFPLWSPLFKGTATGSLKTANTRFDGNTNNTSFLTDFAIPVGAKFYAEVIAKLGSNYYAIFGIAPPTLTLTSYARTQANVYAIEQRTDPSNYKINTISNTTVGSLSSSLGDLDTQVITYGLAVNRVDNEIKLYFNNTLKYTLSIPSTGEFHFMGSHSGGVSVTSVHYNFNGGHDSTGGGDTTAGTASDENGFGEFQYSPPTGFLAPCSPNVPTSTAIDPAETDDNFPQKQCGVVTYTGNAGTNAISGLGFQPDLVWIKIRNTASNGPLVDSSRGSNKVLFSQVTNSEATSANLASFDSDGFTVNNTSDYLANFNGNTNTYVAWCWKANGGTTATNTSGDITSTVQANQAAGFSIVQWTANATSSVATTVGHGLSKAPEFVITKSRESATNWCVTHTGLSSTSHMLFLNSNATETDKSGNGNMSANTSTVFSVNATDGSNAPNTDAMIAYCWHSVDGYSKFGQYEGNAKADGAIIYTGFRPRILIIRVLNVASDGWLMYDTERETFNPLDTILKPHSDAAEYSNAAFTLDIVSNGFKLRSSDNAVNGTSYDPYIYMAWGDAPFKYNNTF